MLGCVHDRFYWRGGRVLGDVYWSKNTELAEKVLNLLRARKQTIACAESCTGGLFAAFFTELAGSSEVFQGGFVVYSNSSKTNLLQIPETLIASVGAVSKEVVVLMASQARNLVATDFGIAVTGIAGPGGGTPTKPVGTVWWCISGKQQELVGCLHLNGTRHDIRMQTVERVLSDFCLMLKG